jgi:hypothetical protein
MRLGAKIAVGVGAVIILLLLLAFVASVIIDEPMRQRMQADMNRSLQGYHVELPYLDFSIFGFSVTLENLTLFQDAYPDPPVMRIGRLKASVHWRALLNWRLVADFELERPEIHVNLIQLRKERAEEVPIQKRGWQGAVNAIYPLKVNLLTVSDGRMTYIDEDPERPLELSAIFLEAENIRNVESPERVYPSEFQFTARVFEKGHAAVDGHADFLAIPYPGVEAQLNLEQVDLAYFQPVLARHHLYISGGEFGALGRIEYAPTVKTGHLTSVRVDDVAIDYIHSAQTAENESAKAEKAQEVVEDVSDRPGLFLRIDDLRLSGEVGFVNEAQDPSYRIFLHQTELHLTNLSNQFREGVAEARLKGYFMGSGETEILARLRPEQDGPDFDLFLRSLGTQMTSMNDLLRAYGNFDVTEGRFSLFTEIHVRDGYVEGYVKPFFRDLTVYDPEQDAEKNLFQRLYEAVLDVIGEILTNPETQKIATIADISGPVEDPDSSTWQIIVNLIRNAFFDIILPGFGAEVGSD